LNGEIRNQLLQLRHKARVPQDAEHVASAPQPACRVAVVSILRVVR